MVCGAGCKQYGGAPNLKGCPLKGGAGMPLSYVNPSYREPSASQGSNLLVSESLLARPGLNHTGGRKKSSRKHRNTRKSKKRSTRKGGFSPSVMAGFIPNAARLVPVAGVTAYRMVRNYKSPSKTRKSRK